MRKVLFGMQISVDGFIAGPNGELDWVNLDPDVDNNVLPELMRRADTALLGRELYQGFYSYWPNAEATNPNLSQGEKDFARWIDEVPKVVFSTTLTAAEWKNSRVVNGNIPAEIARLKQQPGKDLGLSGGARLAQTFVQLGLIDEYWLLVNPVVLGRGIPLFKDVKDRIKLKLIETRSFRSGVVLLTYQPDPSAD